jgi:hypothetical protein
MVLNRLLAILGTGLPKVFLSTITGSYAEESMDVTPWERRLSRIADAWNTGGGIRDPCRPFVRCGAAENSLANVVMR